MTLTKFIWFYENNPMNLSETAINAFFQFSNYKTMESSVSIITKAGRFLEELTQFK